MRKITAVVLHYYSERTQNVKRIITDLKAGSRPPDKIIVFNNNPTMDFRSDVTVINSSENFWTRAKYITCLLQPSDYYLLLDDDITVGNESLSHFELLAVSNNDDFCTSSEGLIEDPKKYTRGQFIREREIEKPTQVDWFCGSLIFCSFNAIIKLLEAETKVRLPDKKYLFEGDDILMGIANQPIFIYPARGDEICHNISENGVNLAQKYPQYSKMRYDFAIKANQILWNKK